MYMYKVVVSTKRRVASARAPRLAVLAGLHEEVVAGAREAEVSDRVVRRARRAEQRAGDRVPQAQRRVARAAHQKRAV